MRVIAHRGASFLEPEQTRRAFVRAFEVGADGVECDVHLTSDDEVVCFHDFMLERTSNGHGPVHEATLAELRGLDLTSWKTGAPQREPGTPSAPTTQAELVTPSRGTTQEIATQNPPTPSELVTLGELLEICLAQTREVTAVIELKSPGPAGARLFERVLDVLERAGWDPDAARLGTVDVSLMSFDPACVAYLARRLGPGPVMQLLAPLSAHDVDPVGRLSAAAATELAHRVETEARATVASGRVRGVGPGIDEVRRDPDAVAAWIRADHLVRVWTVDDPADAALCRDLGVHEITTNRPEIFSGMWHT